MPTFINAQKTPVVVTHKLTDDQTPPTPAIGAVARRIHEKQAAIAALKNEKEKADGYQGGCFAEWDIDRQRERPEIVAASWTRYQEAKAAADLLRDKVVAVDYELVELHEDIARLHQDRWLGLALGGRRLDPPTLPNLAANDPQLADLDRQAATVGEKLRTARGIASTADQDLSDALDRVATIRIAIVRGTAKPSDLAEANRATVAATTKSEQAARELPALEAALGQIARERADHEAALMRAWLPAAKAEYDKRLQTFADTLRTAVIASEALWPLYQEVSHHLALVAPWHDLRVDSQSKFRRWIDEALALGAIK